MSVKGRGAGLAWPWAWGWGVVVKGVRLVKYVTYASALSTYLASPTSWLSQSRKRVVYHTPFNGCGHHRKDCLGELQLPLGDSAP